jgi:class 3 adenylate cyclase
MSVQELWGTPPAGAERAGLRVPRCFAFLDLCGFTSFTETHGDGAAVAVLAQLRAVARAEAEAFGVRLTKWLGDGAMLCGVETPAVIGCTVTSQAPFVSTESCRCAPASPLGTSSCSKATTTLGEP